jgi:hypothetical protein
LSYKVYGRVRRADNGQGIPDLIVKAYDVDWITSDDILGQTITNSNGDFNITFKQSEFDSGFNPEDGPDIIIKIYNSSGIFVLKEYNGINNGKETNFDVRINPLDLLGEYTVSGIVRDARSFRPLSNLNIEAWDDDFIFDDKLGAQITDGNGKYLIPFTESDFSDPFEGNPDVYIKVKNDAGKELTRSITLKEASKHSIVDVNIGAQEIYKRASDCVYEWTAAYRQEGTHIIVRIQLNPDSNLTTQEIENLKTIWKQAIENKWGNRFACCSRTTVTTSTLDCKNLGALTFEVQWVNSNPHHTVRVRRGPETSNMLTWDTNDNGDVTSHEFGHMLGLVDEYYDPVCPMRFPKNSGTVMDDNTEVAKRHVEHFCQLLNENTVQLTIAESLLENNVDQKKEVNFALSNKMNVTIRKELLSKLEAVIKANTTLDKRIKIIHRISGGPVTQRFESKIEIFGNGDINFSFKKEGIEEQHSTKINERSVKNLLKNIQSSGLLKLKEEGGGFLPDSIVGLITLEVDGKETNYVYLADPEQRREQKKMVNQAIALIEKDLKRVTEIAKKRSRSKTKI